ncbi:helix-turn-helix domain-containing protein [Glaciimonas soli]|uniref:helix-turn-helix domain-containing protein n=1 Tax=Glaciimonas soli TaxID=2590999 RepID=UPI0018849F90|nr:XRE family transcriptional regulator [Glaciimonas soli]
MGRTIRARRHKIKKTLVQIAEETGLTAGFLSQLERNQTSASISSLVVIAKALNIAVSDLVEQPAQALPDTYQGQRKPYSVINGQVRYERLSTVFPGSQIHSVKFTMPMGYKSETVSHEGDEMVFVLSGKVEYAVGMERYVLNVGDSLHFDANIPHSVEVLLHQNQQAELIWMGTTKLFEEFVQISTSKSRKSSSGGHQVFKGGTEFFNVDVKAVGV